MSGIRQPELVALTQPVGSVRKQPNEASRQQSHTASRHGDSSTLGSGWRVRRAGQQADASLRCAGARGLHAARASPLQPGMRMNIGTDPTSRNPSPR
jgi:hypothetical protein